MFIHASKRKRGRCNTAQKGALFPSESCLANFRPPSPFLLQSSLVLSYTSTNFTFPPPIAAPSADYHPSLKLAAVAAWHWRQSINIDILQRAKGTVVFCSDFGLTLPAQSRNLLSLSAELRVHSRPAATDSGGRGSGWLQPRCALHGNGWVCKTEQRGRRRRPERRNEKYHEWLQEERDSFLPLMPGQKRIR